MGLRARFREDLSLLLLVQTFGTAARCGDLLKLNMADWEQFLDSNGDTAFRCRVRTSKSNPMGIQTEFHHVFKNADSRALCPVTHFRRFLKRYAKSHALGTDISLGQPPLELSGAAPVTTTSVQRHWNTMARKLGLEGYNFGGHSGRRTALNAMIAQGSTPAQLTLMGRWTSDVMLQDYLCRTQANPSAPGRQIGQTSVHKLDKGMSYLFEKPATVQEIKTEPKTFKVERK